MNKNFGRNLIFAVLILGLISLGVSYINRREVSKRVAGLQTKADPNHPVEVYFGKPEYKSLEAMLLELKVEVYPEDKVETLPLPSMGLGSRITITRATPINIIDAKKEKKYRTWANNLGGLLKEKNIELMGKDAINPDISTEITWNMTAQITRVAEVEIIIKEEIPFKTIKKEDRDMEKGHNKVEVKGEKGEKEVKYLIKRVDGEEVSRKVIETNILKEPETETLIVGIGPKLVKSGPYADLLNKAAKKTLVNATALQCLMLKESGGSADAGFPDAYYKGLFQYEEGYWSAASARQGYSGASIYNAEAQIFTTAGEIARGQGRRWPPFIKFCQDK